MLIGSLLTQAAPVFVLCMDGQLYAASPLQLRFVSRRSFKSASSIFSRSFLASWLCVMTRRRSSSTNSATLTRCGNFVTPIQSSIFIWATGGSKRHHSGQCIDKRRRFVIRLETVHPAPLSHAPKKSIQKRVIAAPPPYVSGVINQLKRTYSVPCSADFPETSQKFYRSYQLGCEPCPKYRLPPYGKVRASSQWNRFPGEQHVQHTH